MIAAMTAPAIEVLLSITVNVDPVIFQAGHLMLRWYGLFLALAVIAGVWLGARGARRVGLSPQQVERLAIWSLVGGLVGARLFHVIDRWDLYASDPLRAVAVWEGGLAIYGGLLGGVAAGALYAFRQRLPVRRLADGVAPGMILGQALGRLACIPNGDAYGSPTNLPWAFRYVHDGTMVPTQLWGVPLHPYPVYEMLFDLGVLGLLLALRRHPTLKQRPGLLFVTYAGVYSVGRFLLSYFRMERVWFAGLQEAQVLSLLGLAAALLGALVLLWPRPGARLEPEPA